MKKLFLTIVTLTMMLVSYQTNGQDKLSVELRPGFNFATKDISDADLQIGFGFEGTIAYKIMPHLAAYTGWSWNHFGADKSFAGTDVCFEETGYSFGLKFIHPIGQYDINYFISAGGTYNHIEIENKDGDIIIDSGHGFGWQTEAGLLIPLSEKFSLLPSVRYRSLSRDVEIEKVNTSLQLDYISVGVGLSWSF